MTATKELRPIHPDLEFLCLKIGAVLIPPNLEAMEGAEHLDVHCDTLTTPRFVCDPDNPPMTPEEGLAKMKADIVEEFRQKLDRAVDVYLQATPAMRETYASVGIPLGTLPVNVRSKQHTRRREPLDPPTELVE